MRERRARPVGAGTEEIRACPPRWLADDDPDAESAHEAMEALASELPDGARPMLPPRAVRLSRRCPLSLPITVVQGRCYLFGVQVISLAERPLARITIPDPQLDEPRSREIDHSMTETFGEGADPVCFEDSFSATVEIATAGRGDLMWVQAFELTEDGAREWERLRRDELAAAAMAAAAENQRRAEEIARCRAAEAAEEAAAGTTDGAPSAATEVDESDAGASDAALPSSPEIDPERCNELLGEDPMQALDADVSDAGADSSVAVVSGWGSTVEDESEEPEPSEEELPAIPEGALAIELPEQCDDGQDNDQDFATDCDDPDCSAFCARYLFDRLPWLRVLDVTLAVGYRVASESIVAQDFFHEGFEPLHGRWGISGRAGATWRFNRYLGVGLDLGLNFLETRAWPPTDRGSELDVDVMGLAFGLSFQASIPVWIMEIGGAIGLGWLHVRTNAKERNLSGDDNAWYDVEGYDRTYNYAYGGGWLWVDFWLSDSFALGLYGGVRVPLAETPELVTNDYNVGLRTTVRLGL